MFEWLTAPIDATRAHDVGPYLSWHARLMVLAWGVLAPVAVLVARFYKVTPWQDWPNQLDNRLWWNVHRGGQYSGLALMAVGLVLALGAPVPAPSVTSTIWLHGALGWATLSLGALQFLSGWLRGTKGGPTDPAPDGSLHGDHYDMTRRRHAFEWLHKSNGYLVLALAAATILTGLWQANAPRWMWVVILGWWVAYAAVFAWLSRSRPKVNTYQAIWGPDPHHPGN